MPWGMILLESCWYGSMKLFLNPLRLYQILFYFTTYQSLIQSTWGQHEMILLERCWYGSMKLFLNPLHLYQILFYFTTYQSLIQSTWGQRKMLSSYFLTREISTHNFVNCALLTSSKFEHTCSNSSMI